MILLYAYIIIHSNLVEIYKLVYIPRGAEEWVNGK